MRARLTATTLSVALCMSLAVSLNHAAGAFAGHAGSGSRGPGLGFHHGFGFHHRFPPSKHLFHPSRFDFGAGFAPRRPNEVAGGYGDYDSDGDVLYEDDVENLHFRVQEPFGPGDIGRLPAGADADSYATERRDYARDGW